MTLSMNQTTFEAKNGLSVRVRRIVADDTLHLLNLFDHMSSESRYRRFHQVVDNVSDARIWEEARHIAEADTASSLGLIAFADAAGQPNAPIAAARYILTSPEDAEVAVSVRDDFQSQGIGSQLLALLAREARAAGVQRFTADVLNSNAAVWGMLKHLPLAVERIIDGTESTLIIDLTQIEDPPGVRTADQT